MAEPKAKTLQQKLGFFDEDLKSPVHDDILKWVHANAYNIVAELQPRIREWSSTTIEELHAKAELENSRLVNEVGASVAGIVKALDDEERNCAYLKKSLDESLKEQSEGKHKDGTWVANRRAAFAESESKLSKLSAERDERQALLAKLNEWSGLGTPPERGDYAIEERKWEFTVSTQSTTSSSGYRTSKSVVGFIDMRISIRVPRLYVVGLERYHREVKEPLHWAQTTYGDASLHHIYVEAKTRIPSLGELFRQLNTYREYVQGLFVVVSPDDKEADLIRQQGIKFVKYPSPRESKEN